MCPCQNRISLDSAWVQHSTSAGAGHLEFGLGQGGHALGKAQHVRGVGARTLLAARWFRLFIL